MFGSSPRLPNRYNSLVEIEDETTVRQIELAAIDVLRAQHIDPGSRSFKGACYLVGDQVLVVRGESFANKKWPAFTSRHTGPYISKEIHHPRYVFES